MPKKKAPKFVIGDRVKFISREGEWENLGTGTVVAELFDGSSYSVHWDGKVPETDGGHTPFPVLSSNIRKVSLYLDLKEVKTIAAGFKEAVTEMRLRAMAYAEDPTKTNRENFDRMYTATMVCAENLESILKEMKR